MMSMESCMNDDFIDWLVEQRIYWLVKSQNFFTEEWLTSELESLIVREQDNNSGIKTELALIVDRLAEEQKKLYQSGLADGISLMKRIDNM